jgi:hypothetical protein
LLKSGGKQTSPPDFSAANRLSPFHPNTPRGDSKFSRLISALKNQSISGSQCTPFLVPEKGLQNYFCKSVFFALSEILFPSSHHEGKGKILMSVRIILIKGKLESGFMTAVPFRSSI